MKKPNIILIQVDQWRADCLSSEGHPVVHTPFLDQLAGKGTSFQKAYVAVPSCIASRASLMTGLTQVKHGRLGYEDGHKWDYPVSLAGEFTKNGYQTQAIGKMHVYPERNRIGFDNVVLHDGFLHFSRSGKYELVDDYIPWLREKTNYTSDYFDHGVSCNSYVARPWDKEEYLHPTNFVTSQAIDFLRKRDICDPFFLYVSYHRPHPPYDPPLWAFEQYLHQTMPPSNVGAWSEKFQYLKQPNNPVAAFDEISPQALQRAKAGYYGHMTHIDHQINRILESLKDYDASENTYIMFTSDHGEQMGDHHFFKKSYPFEGSARLPLILVGPDNTKFTPYNKSKTLIEMRDIMPTLLECAGLPIPTSIDGKSFFKSVFGTDIEINKYIHSEHVLGNNNSVQSIISNQFKYIWISKNGIELFFDLENDPNEIQDLSQDPKHQKLLQDYRNLLINELQNRDEGFVKDKKLVLSCPTVPFKPATS